MSINKKINPVIAVIGLGYVGLPLAVEFGKFYRVIGFDTDHKRINDLLNGKDKTLEVSNNELKRLVFVGSMGYDNMYLREVIDWVGNHPGEF